LAPKNEKNFIISGTMLRVILFGIVHIGNVLELDKLLNTLGVFVKRNEITYWPCYDKTMINAYQFKKIKKLKLMGYKVGRNSNLNKIR
jgi:hypothetical protein